MTTDPTLTLEQPSQHLIVAPTAQADRHLVVCCSCLLGRAGCLRCRGPSKWKSLQLAVHALPSAAQAGKGSCGVAQLPWPHSLPHAAPGYAAAASLGALGAPTVCTPSERASRAQQVYGFVNASSEGSFRSSTLFCQWYRHLHRSDALGTCVLCAVYMYHLPLHMHMLTFAGSVYSCMPCQAVDNCSILISALDMNHTAFVVCLSICFAPSTASAHVGFAIRSCKSARCHPCNDTLQTDCRTLYRPLAFDVR